MAFHSDQSLDAKLTFALTSAHTTAGTWTIGKLPAGYRIYRISVLTSVAGTGSSSPTFSLGISGSTVKYKADGALTVSAGVATYTVVGATAPTAEETIIMTTTGTLPTNSTYDALLIVEVIRV